MKIPKQNICDFLKPAHNLFREMLFWGNQSEGFALFLSQEVFSPYRLPIKFSELVVVTDRFHIKPLLPILSGDGQFYILAISQNEVRLFQCTRHSVNDVDLKEMPRNLAEALKYDDAEKQLQFHTGTPGSRNKRSAVFHGHGVGIDNSKDNILRYFRQIDKGLHELIGDDGFPIVLAGVDYLFPIYREANTYPGLLDQGVEGNPETMSAGELHKNAWKIVKPLFQREQRKAADKYRQFAGSGLASNNIKEIVPASYHGRVDLLFVAIGVQRWGTFDPISNEVRFQHRKEQGNEDLLDFAAIQTILKGGIVYAVALDAVPDEAPLAALLRY
ncbi:MAG: hypothetical protein SRB2_01365 [Desulfobacteraceae bacterium Eth-SRB2]|nr:MAG: hypothetical protein SRB2_01365 [Desulfobacteraceae bacterium Eth-SRB2]